MKWLHTSVDTLNKHERLLFVTHNENVWLIVVFWLTYYVIRCFNVKHFVIYDFVCTVWFFHLTLFRQFYNEILLCINRLYNRCLRYNLPDITKATSVCVCVDVRSKAGGEFKGIVCQSNRSTFLEILKMKVRWERWHVSTVTCHEATVSSLLEVLSIQHWK